MQTHDGYLALLQDQLHDGLIEHNPDAADLLRARSVSAQGLISGGEQVDALIQSVREQDGDIAVYGDSLEAYTVLAALQDMGFATEKIKFVAPPSMQVCVVLTILPEILMRNYL